MGAFPVTGPQTITFSQAAAGPKTVQRTGAQTITFTQTGVGLKDVSRSASQLLNFVQTQTRGLVLPTGITITESIESRRLEKTSKGRQLTRMFFIKGTDDPVKADAFGPQIGDIYNDSDGNPEGTGFTDATLIAARRNLSPLVVGAGGEKAIGLEVLYGEIDTNPSGVSRQVSLDISGQSVRIERAFSQKNFPSVEDAELKDKWGLAIGPKTRGNELKGVNRIDTAVSMAETHERSRLSQAYKQTLLDLHGTVNRNVFRGFAIGTVLFQGFRANTTADGRWQLQFEFSVAPFSTIIDFDEFVNSDSDILGIEQVVVSGHEYLWIDWKEQAKEDLDKGLKRVILSAHVATIFKDADFAALEIGTDPLD